MENNVIQKSSQNLLGSQTSANKMQRGSPLAASSKQGSKTSHEASASTLFSKSFEKVKDLLPDKFDKFGNPVAPAGFHAADDEDDWELYLELIGGEEGGEHEEEEEEEAAEETPRRQLCVNELDVTASVTDIDWCIKHVGAETMPVKRHLQKALMDSMDAIIQHIYDAKPALPTMKTTEADATADRATELIDLCYQERYDDVKCPAFTRQLRRALTDLELKEALGLLDMLESAAVSDRKVAEISSIRRPPKTPSPTTPVLTSKPDHSWVLTRTIITIVDNLDVNTAFLDELKRRRVINDHMLVDVLSRPNRTRRALRLSELLLSLGPLALQETCEAMVVCGYAGLAGNLQNLLHEDIVRSASGSTVSLP